MKLIDFWPEDDEEHIMDCFFTDADSAKEAVFLAVHQPMQLVRENFRSQKSESIPQDENQVLKALLKKNPANGTLILPIVGGSGVGKSHLIRWLHAHLELLEDRDSRHVVRIPKSASLRTVLNRIFNKLPGENFDDLRARISEVKLPEDRQKAAWDLQSNLMAEIETLGRVASTRDMDPELRQPLDRERKTHCTRDCLMALLGDPVINRHFTEVNESDPSKSGVLVRIAERCVEGSLDARNEFELGDFGFLDRIENENDLARPTRNYLKLVRATKGMELVVKFLNEVVDVALGGLVKTGSDSLADILGEVRERLFAESKELVLLVEDYAVLAGVQEPFRAAMVQDAFDENGEQIRCVLRTAFAVTEGSHIVETVMTRADVRWVIGSHPFSSKEEALVTFQNFVGGYLNAARYGSTRLAEAFKNRKENSRWVPNFYDDHEETLTDEDRSRLEAFGFSPADKHPLFPLNSGVIEQLAIAHLGESDGNFRFDPRVMINRLLLDPIKDGRTFFETGKYPPASFHPQFKFERLEREVGTVLNQQIAGDELQRIALLVYFWGNNPESTGHAAALSPRILETFDLPTVDWAAEPIVIVDPPPLPEPEDKEPVEGRRAADFLKSWQRDGTIAQSNANSVRQWIARGINDFLEENSLLKTKLEVTWKNIYLPRASQGPQEADDALIVVGRDEELDDSPGAMLRFFADMTAVARFNNRGDWDYDGGEADFVRYANLIESLASVAEKHFREEGATKSFPNAGVRPLAQALMLNARILDIDGASSERYEDNLRALLAPTPERTEGRFGPGTSQNRWEKLRENARNSRDEMRELLLTAISARQGRGEPLAVDAAELVAAVSELKNENKWELKADLGFDRNALETGVAKEHVFNELTKSLRSVVKERQESLKLWRDQVTASLGESFDLEETKTAFREVVTKAARVGVYQYKPLDPDQLRTKIRDIGRVKALLENAGNAVLPDREFGQVLTALSRVENSELERVIDVLGHFEKFMETAEAEADSILNDAPESIDESAAELDSRFESLSRVWEDITKISQS